MVGRSLVSVCEHGRRGFVKDGVRSGLESCGEHYRSPRVRRGEERQDGGGGMRVVIKRRGDVEAKV